MIFYVTPSHGWLMGWFIIGFTTLVTMELFMFVNLSFHFLTPTRMTASSTSLWNDLKPKLICAKYGYRKAGCWCHL